MFQLKFILLLIMDYASDKLIICVGGIDESVNEKILHADFIPFGEIKTIEIPLDHNTGNIFLN